MSPAPRRGEDRFTPSSRSPSVGDSAEATREAGSPPTSDASASTSTSDAAPSESASGAKAEEADDNGTAPRDTTGEPLSEQEQEQVEELRARDREVRQHEQAHKAAAGQYATSGPTYSFQQGPDGRRYAVGGEVGIDTSQAETPEATIRKMQQVRRAALAPAEPSAQDRRVAAQATQTASTARAELSEQQRAERSGQGEQDNAGGVAAAGATSDAAAIPDQDASREVDPDAVEDAATMSRRNENEAADVSSSPISDNATLNRREPVGGLVNVLA